MLKYFHSVGKRYSTVRFGPAPCTTNSRAWSRDGDSLAHLTRSQDSRLGAAEHLGHDVLWRSLSALLEAVDAEVGSDDVHQSSPCLGNALKINRSECDKKIVRAVD